ncbi:hypothetical protein PCASD_26211 [Puccinia coronata f. sp. avenae]|uniref:Tyr recombinase domain-containing protein n=1 Tax=Puccinia coronata f. sp. avenae TaxID=200324 RepID=A0A2N5TN30_9BASI|nr:hypothetical protein PCASD_26211 [Puccinia coronata f. sp. avenae]
MSQDLLVVADWLTGGSPRDQAIFDLALVAFWGLARLGKVTSGSSQPVTTQDFSFFGAAAVITLQAAKTAGPGELQYLTLAKLYNCLCPVSAVTRLLSGCTTAGDQLFGYLTDTHWVTLSKPEVVSKLHKVWRANSRAGLSGHSFWMGGALFRYALGVSTEAICEAGRWKSDSYNLYMKSYSTASKADSFSLLRALDATWCAGS